MTNYESEVFHALYGIYSNPDNKDRYGQVGISCYSEYALKKVLGEDVISYLKENGSKYGLLQTYGGRFGTYKAVNPTSEFYQEIKKK
jgi:hypothetical protein